MQFNKQVKFVNTSGAPFTVNSSTVVSNLNADLLDGNDASAFALANHSHSYLPLSGGTVSGNITANRLYISEANGAVISGRNGISGTGDDNDLWIYKADVGRFVFMNSEYHHFYQYVRIGSDYTKQQPSYNLQVDGSANAITLYENGSRVITTANIGSQNVNYSTSAGSVSWANISSKPSAAGDATTPVYWTGSGFTTCTAYSNASVNYAATAGTANMIANNITVTGTSTIDNGISFSNGTRSIFFGNGSSGNSGIYTPTEGWLVGISPNGSVFLNGNATSATKLATSRTIWGQSFDGSANVSGNMSGVGSINNILHFKTAGANTKLNIEELSLTINGTHLFVASQSGTYTNSRPLILQYGYGNVGIGVTAPEYKLEVSGDVKATNFRGILIGNADTATTATSATTATTASKLSTVSKTAWGQTYWTTGGVPTTISGAMTDVTTIDGYVSFTTKQSSNPVLNISTIYAATDYISIYVTATHRPLVLQLDAGNVGVGVAQPSYKLDVNGSANATTLYENGNRVITSGNIGSQSVNYATSAGSSSSVPSMSNSEIDTIMV